MARLYIRLLIFCGLLVATSPASADSEPALQSLGQEKAAAPIKFATPSYAKFNAQFKQLCSLLIADGRRDFLVARLESGGERDPGCVGCRPFIRTIFENCRPPKARKVKKRAQDEGDSSEDQPEATPTPLPVPRREPSTALIGVVSALFHELAEEPKVAIHYQAIQKFSALLLPPGERTTTLNLLAPPKAGALTPAAKEYFSILLTYVHAPFAEHVAAARRDFERSKNRPSAKSAPRHGDPDEMFDF